MYVVMPVFLHKQQEDDFVLDYVQATVAFMIAAFVLSVSCWFVKGRKGPVFLQRNKK